jgi:hypothetical protein
MRIVSLRIINKPQRLLPRFCENKSAKINDMGPIVNIGCKFLALQHFADIEISPFETLSCVSYSLATILGNVALKNRDALIIKGKPTPFPGAHFTSDSHSHPQKLATSQIMTPKRGGSSQ